MADFNVGSVRGFFSEGGLRYQPAMGDTHTGIKAGLITLASTYRPQSTAQIGVIPTASQRMASTRAVQHNTQG